MFMRVQERAGGVQGYSPCRRQRVFLCCFFLPSPWRVGLQLSRPSPAFRNLHKIYVSPCGPLVCPLRLIAWLSGPQNLPDGTSVSTCPPAPFSPTAKKQQWSVVHCNGYAIWYEIPFPQGVYFKIIITIIKNNHEGRKGI
uniref:Uncharacterized protein n=1 Tax=Trypanosoma congolense (strain IL3000) TaxID=1068625 RepID=G0UQW1_TRYCI|nr:hypothetical protein, unlikely [Trypanosoma congolense IL3000]